MSTETCDYPRQCDKQCKDHSNMASILSDHKDDIEKLFIKTDNLENRTSILEGKFTVYFYVSLGFLGTLIIIALYSYLQLVEFKKEYRSDMKMLTNSNFEVVKENIKSLHELDMRVFKLESLTDRKHNDRSSTDDISDE